MGAIVPDVIEDYLTGHTSPLPSLLDELIETTREKKGVLARMLSGHVQGVLLQMLVSSTGARRVLELGTFTGYSALMMAAALPDDGELVTCDADPDALAIARGFFARSEHGHKISVREGPAIESLRSLDPPFGFVYIDADKGSYIPYYEASIRLLAPGGLIACDNVLQRGRVLDRTDEAAQAIADFNAHVRADPRVTNLVLPLGDGIHLVHLRHADARG